MPCKGACGVVAAIILCFMLQDAFAERRGLLQQDLSFNSSKVKWTPAWQTLPSSVTPAFDYAEAMHKALIYLRIMRSGKIISSDSPPTALPVSDYHIAWRSNSCSSCRGIYNEDLSGGYYEAGGSYLKVGLPKAFSMTQLAWTIVRHRDALYRIGLLDEALGALRWGTNYFVNCHNASAGTFMVVLGDSAADFRYYGPPELYEKYVGKGRPVSYANPYSPATEVTAETAATLAAASLAFNATDPAYAAELLQHASDIFDIASVHPQSYMDSKDPGLKTHAELYPSTGYNDELAWAAVWLYKASGQGPFLTAAMSLFNASQADGNSKCCGYGTFSWDTKSPGVALLMAELDLADSPYSAAIQQFCNWYLPGSRTVPHTSNGLAYPYQGWGALRYATNAAAVCMFYAESLLSQPKPTRDVAAYAAQLFNYGKSQVDFALGSSGRSYVVGFGQASPKSPFQKDAWNSWINYKPGITKDDQIRNDFLSNPQPNRFMAYGAMVGGPTNKEGTAYNDSRNQTYRFSEPALDYNAGLILALSPLVNFYKGLGPFDECGLDFGYAFPGAPPPPESLVAVCGPTSTAAGHTAAAVPTVQP